MNNNPYSYNKLKHLDGVILKRIVAMQIYLQCGDDRSLNEQEKKMRHIELHARCEALQEVKQFLDNAGGINETN